MQKFNSLPPETRFMLCRPRGGLNDLLCQIEKCRIYALETDRILVLDTKESGVQCEYADLFEPLSKTSYSITPEILARFEAETSVHPIEIVHRIGTIKTVFSTELCNRVDKKTGLLITFPEDGPCDARLVVHVQCGGGSAGLNALTHMRLKREIANEVIKRIAPLGWEYDAVHIRHTDYATDYKPFLAKLVEGFRGKRVLICSDSKEVKDYAKSLLSGIAETIEVSQIPEMDGIPLHEENHIDRYMANIDLLSDLLALARAQNYYFTTVSGGFPSGFSLLARGLLTRPETVENMLSCADPEYLDMLEKAPISPAPKSHMIKLVPRPVPRPGSSLKRRFKRAYALIKRHIVVIVLALIVYYSFLIFYAT